MARYNNDSWLNELEEKNSDEETRCEIPEDLLNDVHEAMNRFHHKEIKRNKVSKKKNQCWQ
jgi:hypothetical protein